ncbi:MAG: DUF2231 domain-containing protein [Gammaproteobacteria bacterium]
MIAIEHVHPMLVHFPIVLLMAAIAVDFLVLVRGGALASRQGLPVTALWALLLGTLFAMAAAFFGDIALDKAVELGFSQDPLEFHETLATATIIIFAALSLLRLFAVWRGFALSGGWGWLVALLGLVGVAVLLVTAYYGGSLVYQLGVNVAPVKP